MKAFPSTEPIYGSDVIGVKENSGMDLRDYFAGQALPRLIEWYTDEEDAELLSNPCVVAETAYQYADAMMEAREK